MFHLILTYYDENNGIRFIYCMRSILRILPQHGQKTITMSGKRLEKLEEKYKQEKNRHPTLSFSAFITESAIMELERRQILREAQFISLIGIHDNVVTLKDARNNEKFIEVQIGERKAKCLSDGTSDCIHVGFVYALPEVMRTLKAKD